MSDAMRGIKRAKHAVKDTLDAEFNPYLVELRERWDLSEEYLPYVEAIRPNEPQALDEWPLMALSGVRSSLVRHEITPDADVAYLSTFTLRLFVWVKAPGWDRTIDLRDNLSAAARQFLLDRPKLADVTVTEESDLSEEYSDVQPVKGDRFVAGSYIEFDVEALEVIYRDRLGTVGTTGVTAHPGLE